MRGPEGSGVGSFTVGAQFSEAECNKSRVEPLGFLSERKG